jgi:hypothetical protein
MFILCHSHVILERSEEPALSLPKGSGLTGTHRDGAKRPSLQGQILRFAPPENVILNKVKNLVVIATGSCSWLTSPPLTARFFAAAQNDK